MNPLLETFYFTCGSRKIYGEVHIPRGLPCRSAGFVFCPPVEPEYMCNYRDMQGLFCQMASIGYHVLKFDYYGCGDSEGWHEDATQSLWQANIAAAVIELQQAFDLCRIGLMGLRLGGSLASLVASQLEKIDDLILLDPVVYGSKHLRELLAMQRQWADGSFVSSTRNQNYDSNGRDILGYWFSQALLHDIQKINILSLEDKPASRVLLLSTGTPAQRELREHFCSLGSLTTCCHIPQAHAFDSIRSKYSVDRDVEDALRVLLSWINTPK